LRAPLKRPSVTVFQQQEDAMAVAKVIEVTAGSKKGLEDAIEQGMAKASDSLENIEGAWIQDIKVTAKNGKISEWRVNMKVTFVLN
jgi:flavin-binding protein dodecin